MSSPPLPPTPPSRPAGFAAPAEILLSPEQQQQLSQTARQVMADPLLKWQLTQRVYELMQADLRWNQERAHSYGGDF